MEIQRVISRAIKADAVIYRHNFTPADIADLETFVGQRLSLNSDGDIELSDGRLIEDGDVIVKAEEDCIDVFSAIDFEYFYVPLTEEDDQATS